MLSTPKETQTLSAYSLNQMMVEKSREYFLVVMSFRRNTWCFFLISRERIVSKHFITLVVNNQRTPRGMFSEDVITVADTHSQNHRVTEPYNIIQYLHLEGIHKMIESNSWLQTVPSKIRILLLFFPVQTGETEVTVYKKKKNAANEACSTQQYI